METINVSGVDWSVWDTKSGPRAKADLNDTFPITLKTTASDAVVYTKDDIRKLVTMLAKAIGEDSPVDNTNKKSGGVKDMAKKTLTQVAKKEAAEAALKVACNTAGKQLKKTAVAALKNADHPMAKEAAKFLNTSHGQAILMLLAGFGLHILPTERLGAGSGEKLALLAQNFRMEAMVHFGNIVSDEVVDVFLEPLIANLAKPLAAAGDVLAALPGSVAGEKEEE